MGWNLWRIHTEKNRDQSRDRERMGCMKLCDHFDTALLPLFDPCPCSCLNSGSARCEYTIKVALWLVSQTTKSKQNLQELRRCRRSGILQVHQRRRRRGLTAGWGTSSAAAGSLPSRSTLEILDTSWNKDSIEYFSLLSPANCGKVMFPTLCLFVCSQGGGVPCDNYLTIQEPPRKWDLTVQEQIWHVQRGSPTWTSSYRHPFPRTCSSLLIIVTAQMGETPASEWQSLRQ